MDIIDTLSELGLELRKTSNTNGGEWHGPCPFCKEGKDRFFVTPNHPNYKEPVYYCRRCEGSGKGGKVSDLIKYLGGTPSAANKSKTHYKNMPNRQAKYTKQPPSEEWQVEMTQKIDEVFTSKPSRKEPFRRRGITPDTVKALKLGYSEKVRFVKIQEKTCKIGIGMVIPNYRYKTLYSLQIRQWPEGSGYRFVPGSTVVPYHVTKLNKIEAPVVIVESALDAAILYQEAGDLIHAVAMVSSQNKPDPYLKTLLAKATNIFVCMDYDEAGIEATDWWRQFYPNAHIVFQPTGKDIGEFHLAYNSVRAWVNDLLNGTIPPRPKPDVQVSLLENGTDAESLLQEIKSKGFSPGISISEIYIGIGIGDRAFAIDLVKVPISSLKILEDMRLIAHDGVYCIESLKTRGLNCRYVESTQLQFLLINGMKWELEKVSQFRLGYGSAWCSDAVYKTALEASICLEIFKIQDKKMQERNLSIAYDIYAQAQYTVAEIRTNGFGFDLKKHKQVYKGWNDALKQLTPECQKYNSLKHMKTTYGSKYSRHCHSESQRIYPDFHYSETPTGRFNCINPNLMGVPKTNNLREAFKASEGNSLIGADFSLIDLRVAAMISGDEKMIEAFRNNVDFHTLTASIIYGVKQEEVSAEQRQKAKSVNYAMIYGGTSRESEKARKRLRENFPHLYKWMGNQSGLYLKKNMVRTPAGRAILRNSDFPKWRRHLTNYPIQGGSQEVLLAAMAKLPAALHDLDAKIILCVHDEIILEVSEQNTEAAGKALVNAMENGFQKIFPDGPTDGLVKVKQGRTWADIS